MNTTKALMALLALTALTGADAARADEATQPTDPGVLHITCRFGYKHRKDGDRGCKAEIDFATFMTQAALIPPPTENNFRVRCDGETVFRGSYRAGGATAGASLDPGLLIVAAYGEGKTTFPAVYVDSLFVAPGFLWAPADLRLEAEGRVLHGSCERD